MPIYSRIVTQNASSFGGIMVESGALDHTDGGILQIPWFHGSSMAMIMVCKNFRIQIIQMISDGNAGYNHVAHHDFHL